jgi:adenosine kinase
MSNPQLIISGSIAIDRIMNFSGRYKDLIQPDKLHVLSLSVLLDKLEETQGGVGANIAYNAAQLGEQPILLGSVGPDAAAYVEQLSSAGVNTGFIHVSKLPTASFNVMTDSDDNQVGGFYPGAMADSATLDLSRWAGQDVLVSVSAHDPAAMRAQVAQCQQHGLRLFYDPGQQVSNVPGADLQAGVAAAEALIVNDFEMGVLCTKTEMEPDALKAKIPIVITTYGKDGSIIEGARVKAPVKVAAAQPTQVVDPTGAGDAYRAGFLYGYLRQWELPACGRLGAVVASFIIERHGTQQRLSKPAIIKRYRETFNEEVTL